MKMRQLFLSIFLLIIILSPFLLYTYWYKRFITRVYTVDAFKELKISTAETLDLKMIESIVQNNKYALMQSVHNHSSGYPINDLPQTSQLIYWTKPWLINKYLKNLSIEEKRLIDRYCINLSNRNKLCIQDIRYIPNDKFISFDFKDRLVIDLYSEEWIVEHKVVNSINPLIRSRWPQYRFYRSRPLGDGWSYIITAHRRKEGRSGESSMLLWFKRTMLSPEQRAVAETLRVLDESESASNTK